MALDIREPSIGVVVVGAGAAPGRQVTTIRRKSLAEL